MRPLTCNIDAKGKVIRLCYGVVLMIGGIIMAVVWAWPRGSAVGWVVAVSAFLGGVFCIFEARAGWCAIRAMGFKTPF